MKRVSELNWHADKFRMMAKRATSPEQKTMLSKMAEMCENLAKEREAESVVRPDRRSGTSKCRYASGHAVRQGRIVTMPGGDGLSVFIF